MTNEETSSYEETEALHPDELLNTNVEKINALVAENEELLNDNVEKTETLNNLRNSITEIQRENQVIHTALYEEQEKNVNLEITIKTLTKMVKQFDNVLMERHEKIKSLKSQNNNLRQTLKDTL